MMSFNESPMICLMGPTASGKTPIAIELANEFPLEIISVDSAMVYRGLNIGTAKPTSAELKKAPHHLIDIRDPKEIYSAGEFYQDAFAAIEIIKAKGKIPLLVGGTMLYFRVLQKGMAHLPKADPILRRKLQQQIEQTGLATLYQQLQRVDPQAAARIKVQDSHRIQRALEIYLLTGKPISAWQAETKTPPQHQFQQIAIMPERVQLHQRIQERFDNMLQLGFLDEVRQLYDRGDLSPELPAIRSVGYRQAWDYLAGKITYQIMCERAITATRQLAKRQLTWLRSWPNVYRINLDQTLEKVRKQIKI